MPPAVLFLKSRLAAAAADRRTAGQIALIAAVHLAAVALLLTSEDDPAARAAFVLSWSGVNLFWLAVIRRPLPSALLSLAMVVVLIMVSQFKHGVLMMTATFVDLMVVDLATFWFLMAIIPGLAWKAGLALALATAVLSLAWQLDSFRVRPRVAATGCGLCCMALAGLSL